jgi:heptaprenyl diphosphate synthase
MIKNNLPSIESETIVTETSETETMKYDYDDAFEKAKGEVERYLSTSPLIIRQYTKHLMAPMGKMIRAASVLCCAEDKEGGIHEDAVKLAAAIEVLHLATLVHDDVIDNAEIRRGKATLQNIYGKRTAVICGDYLLCLALKLAASVSKKKDYLDMDMPDYISRVCLGELNQHINNGNFDLTIKQYLKIISGKTAALFEASFYAGAVLSGVEENVLSKYKQLGRYIGMIFQLTDDCMDFEETEDVAKKPVQSDYEQNVFTLPLIHAFRKLPSLKEKAKNKQISRTELNLAVEKTGGLGYTWLVAKKYYDKSLIIIESLEITDNKKERLKIIANKAYRAQ